MDVEITTAMGEIDFGATGANEILQNVRTILSTPKYTVPLDRNFGLNAIMLDTPMPVAQAKLTSEIIVAVHRYEPRFRVTQVTFTGDGLEGILRPKVRGRIIE